MKTKRLEMIIIASVIVLIGLSIGVVQIFLSEWKEYKTLGKIWPRFKAEEVQEIVFCETDVPEIENWFVRFEVPDEAMETTLQYIDKALKETKIRRDVWDIKRLKIITNKNKYIVPVNWTNEKIYGNDWTSYELREYLREYGFADP